MTRRSWREARRYVLGALIVGGALLLARRRSGWVAVGAAAAAALFFRDPERRLVPDPDIVYAAADGVVAGAVSLVSDPWMPGGEAARISTFLSLHNVHVNRSPVHGRIVDREEIRGGYAPALLGRSEANYRNRLAIDGPAGRVVVVQIAGTIARKIACWVQPGDDVSAGQRIGLIHFGSRTDVLLPVGRTQVLVAAGDRVRAGITPLARYRGTGGRVCESS